MFFELEGKSLPLVSIGTSPFIGAGQFGARGREYRQKFFNNAELMAELLIESHKYGCRGVEAIPAGKILDAVRIVKDQLADFVLTGSTYWSKSDLRIEDLARLEARIIFVHGAISDMREPRILEPILKRIRDVGIH
ncbi:MAG: hypothetical protein ACTSRW_00020 [Candidatus Helarchaeota archaeon]